MRPPAYTIKLRLYAGDDDDLLDWAQAHTHAHGELARALRTALRAGIATSSPPGDPRLDAILDTLARIQERLQDITITSAEQPLADPALAEAAANLDGLLDRIGEW